MRVKGEREREKELNTEKKRETAGTERKRARIRYRRVTDLLYMILNELLQKSMSWPNWPQAHFCSYL